MKQVKLIVTIDLDNSGLSNEETIAILQENVESAIGNWWGNGAIGDEDGEIELVNFQVTSNV